jgi:hypothetical protein
MTRKSPMPGRFGKVDALRIISYRCRNDFEAGSSQQQRARRAPTVWTEEQVLWLTI